MKELPIKNEFGSALLELSRMAATERVTVSRMVSYKPCWLMSVTVETNDTDSKSQVKLLNGDDSSERVLLNLKGRYAHPTHCGCFPVYFNRGLYVDLTDNADGCTVQFIKDTP